jgi:predicted nucleotide-binding protein
MEREDLIKELQAYKAQFEGILERFSRKADGFNIGQSDDPIYRQIALEIRVLLQEELPGTSYAALISGHFREGISNYLHTPSYASVQRIIGVVGAAITHLKRNPEIVSKTTKTSLPPTGNKVFVIHGRDEAKWRELKDVLRDKFELAPIVLEEQPDAGCSTVVEKFERYAPECTYAIAIFTPDDEVSGPSGERYVQARPNVLYELGWFCGRLGRERVMLLLKEGTSLFSDFGGIIRKEFRTNVREKIGEIEQDLAVAGIIPKERRQSR